MKLGITGGCRGNIFKVFSRFYNVRKDMQGRSHSIIDKQSWKTLVNSNNAKF